MNEMIERVAKAIEPETFALPSINLNRDVYERAYRRARYAIEAMREPTEAMTKAAVDKALSVSLSHEYRWPDYMRDLHRIQIDAALSPAGEK